MNFLVGLLLAVTTIWVYVDATKNKIGRIPGTGGIFNMSAGAWGTVTLFLWIVGFPAYLIKRSDLIRDAGQHPVEVSYRGVKIGVFSVVGLMIALCSLPIPDQSTAAPQDATPAVTETPPEPAPDANTPDTADVQQAATDTDGNKQDDVSVEGIKLTVDDQGNREIVGVVTNNTDHHITNAVVNFNLYDNSGAQVGNSIDVVDNLEPHGKWKFSAVVSEDSATSYKFKGVTIN